jgi:hypothetical protein
LIENKEMTFGLPDPVKSFAGCGKANPEMNGGFFTGHVIIVEVGLVPL